MQHNRALIASSLYLLKKQKVLGGILYIIAVILVIRWAIGFLGYNAGGGYIT